MIDSGQALGLEQKLSGKHVMITGGLGMLGSTMAHQLVKCKAKVTIVDACIEPYGANMFNLEGIRDQIDLNITDIRDKEAIKVLVKDKDIIFNFAAQVSHNDSIDDPFLDADINYIGHLNVLENVRKFNPKAKVLFSGSRLQFGPIESIPVDEDHPLRPKTPYAFNKTVAESMYLFYYEVHGIPCIVFRIANTYGIRCQMRHSKYSIVNYFIRQAMEDKPLTIFGDGKQLRDYIYVDDLVNVFLLASIIDEAEGRVFNVGGGIGTRFKDMMNMVAEVVGKGEVVHVPWPDNYLNVETGDYVTDISKVSTMLGWRPLVGLREGIEMTHAYYEKYRTYYF
ncbi:GDP-mannose 4,6-dehydratase [Nitrospinae bacterium AH_259_B05_G02_I21]|nr:GDP-mannose 4,6-dehydratase [Nitrospinae bacterium AH_259_B05_G02_I21]MDA2931632.1 GDP-mannose 4,6-dehydratase [Nitrospinae bacterium AH-259-F20]